MENDTNKLEHFTETILRDADERSQKILESVEKARKARLNSAEKELKARMERQVEAGIAQVKSKTGQAVSQKMMEDSLAGFALHLGNALFHLPLHADFSSFSAELSRALRAFSTLSRIFWLRSSASRRMVSVKCSSLFVSFSIQSPPFRSSRQWLGAHIG